MYRTHTPLRGPRGMGCVRWADAADGQSLAFWLARAKDSGKGSPCFLREMGLGREAAGEKSTSTGAVPLATDSHPAKTRLLRM